MRWPASQCHLPSGGETDIFEVDTRTAVDQRKHRNVVLLLILLFNTLDEIRKNPKQHQAKVEKLPPLEPFWRG